MSCVFISCKFYLHTRRSSNFDQMGPHNMELSKKYPNRLVMRKKVFPSFLACFRCNPFDTFM